MKKYKVGDKVYVALDPKDDFRVVTFPAVIVATPDDDVYDLGLLEDELGIELDFEDSAGIEVVNILDIVGEITTNYE